MGASLSKVAAKLMKSVENSKRSEILFEHIDTLLPHIFNLYYASISYHKTVQTISVSGFGLNGWLVIRSQLEALLIFLYLTEPFDDLEEIEDRTLRYRDWTIVKMYQNSKKSSGMDILNSLSTHVNFEKKINDNFKYIQEEYKDKQDELKILKNSSSFLRNKAKIADNHGFKDLYNHVQAECSASLHIADSSDRMKVSGNEKGTKYSFGVNLHDGLWSMLLSNLLFLELLKNFSLFFGIKDVFHKRISTITKF